MKHLLCFLTLVSGVALGADKYAIDAMGLSKDGKIHVRFIDSAAPSDADAKDGSHWLVEAVTQDAVIPGTISGALTTNDAYATIPVVTLPVQFMESSTFPVGTVRFVVIYSQGGDVATQTALINKKEVPESKTNSDSNVTVFGGINAAVGSKPTYNIDAALDLHPMLSGFGVKADVKTDNRPRADPDSFSGKLDYRFLLTSPKSTIGRQTVFQGAELQLDYAGVEFDRAGKNLNFVSSPYLVLPFAFHTAAAGAVTNTLGLDLKLGMEAGNNFRNSLTREGYGCFVRTLGGAAANLTFRAVPGLSKLVLGSSYEVRLPNKAELLGTTDTAGDTRYMYSKKARHWVSSSISLFFNSHWSLTAQHSYGALPPVFNFTDQQLSFGLKYTLKNN